MAISITWATRTIVVPKADLTFISGITYEFDVNAFRLALKDLEDGEEGIAFPTTHTHNTQVVLSGTTYARTFEIINGYTVDFTSPDTNHYTIKCVGANHNIADVLSSTHRHFSLIVGNSAGLIVSTGPTLVDANILSIDGSTESAELMRIASETMIVGTIATVVSASEITVTFTNFDSEETTSLEGRRVIITSGTKAKEAARITSYAGNGAGNPATLGLTALSSLPVIGATVVVV
jgi:hypothetical protein